MPAYFSTKAEIQRHKTPAKGHVNLVFTRCDMLGVRITSKGARSYIARNRIRFIDNRGHANTKPADITLASVDDIALDTAESLARRARALFEQSGEKNAVASQLFVEQRGTVAARSARAQNSVTLEERRHEYFTAQMTRRKNPWKEKTVKLNSATWRNHILPALGADTPIEEVSTEMVDALIDDLSKGEKLQERIHEALTAFRNWCDNARKPVAYAKPVINVTAPPLRRIKGCKEKNLCEIRAVGRRCFDILRHPDTYGLQTRRLAFAHLVAAYSGLRIGSITGLNEDSVVRDADEAETPLYMHIPAVDMKGTTPSNFSVPMSRGLKRVLDLLDADENGNYFRPSFSTGVAQFQRDMLFIPVCHALGLGVPADTVDPSTGKTVKAPLPFEITFHAWRHTLSTWCGNLGMAQETIEIALAHSLNKTVGSSHASTYNHSDDYLRTKDLWDVYSDFLDFLIFTDVELPANGEITPKIKREFEAWRKEGAPMLQVV